MPGNASGSVDTSSGRDSPRAATDVCFVVMPFGREAAEQRWFKGWFEAVIKPGVLAAGYRPVLAAAEEQPGAINDEIRAHLALDPMVVVDLGGMEPDDDPNPNVMYELGIRHALGLPLVIMAWAGQRLPFDVSNQRAIMESRDLLGIEVNKSKLTAFITAAAEGRYYRPMEAVARVATIEAASSTLDDGSILTALVQEVRQLKSVVASAAFSKHVKPYRQFRPTIKTLLHNNNVRKQVYNHFLSSGGVPALWSRVLRLDVPPEFQDTAREWSLDQWIDYIVRRAGELPTAGATVAPALVKVVASTDVQRLQKPGAISDELIEMVRSELPTQPWPTGTHKIVRAKLGISDATFNRVVAELIRRGVFKDQVDGKLVEVASDDSGTLA